MSGKILVIDDDRFYQEFCKDVLEEEGYKVKTTFTGTEALAILRDEKFDLALIDLVLPEMSGALVLEKAKLICPDLDLIIMTGYASVESAVQCLKAGASDYLTKPLNPEELKITVKRIIELRHLFDENVELKSLLLLYENCQRISSCLELEKLYKLGLDGLMSVLGGKAGLAVFSSEERKGEELKAFSGINAQEAESLFDFLLERELSLIPEKPIVYENPSVCEKYPMTQYLNCKSLVVFPFHILDDRLQGTMAILCPKQLSLENLGDNVHFVFEQIQRSLENALKYQDAQRLIFIDDLTGLFNTRYLDVALQTELSRSRRYKNHLSVLFVDLDYFKLVNDSYGHLVGSWLLVEVARVLKSCVREIDVVVRYGGDEFVIILSETDLAGAKVVAERIRQRMAEHQFMPRNDLILKITCCVGIATFPDDGQTKEELIHLADKAMYRGKETTRNVVYSASSL